MLKQHGGGSVISFCTMCKGGGGGRSIFSYPWRWVILFYYGNMRISYQLKKQPEIIVFKVLLNLLCLF